MFTQWLRVLRVRGDLRECFGAFSHKPWQFAFLQRVGIAHCGLVCQRMKNGQRKFRFTSFCQGFAVPPKGFELL